LGCPEKTSVQSIILIFPIRFFFPGLLGQGGALDLRPSPFALAEAIQKNFHGGFFHIDWTSSDRAD
jgi:hypothetical protein